MSDTVMYDLIPENFSALQSLIFSMASEFMREQGVGKGRGAIMAEDYIAAELLTPKEDGTRFTGPELSHWMAVTRNKFRHPQQSTGPVLAAKVMLTAHKEIELPAKRDIDTFNQRLTGKNHRMDPTLAAMLAACAPIKPGEVWSIPCNSEDEARTLSTYLRRVAKQLGWRVGDNIKSYQFQIFSDRLKIKRTQ